jgi:hypothetical protein
MMIEQQEPAQYPPPTSDVYQEPQPPATPKKKHIGWIIAGAVAVIVTLCIGGAIVAVSVVGSSDDTPKVTATGRPAEVTQPAETEPAEPVAVPSDNGNGTTARIGETLSLTGTADVDYTLVRTEQKTVDQWGDRADRGVYLLVYFTVKVKSGSEFVYDGKFSYVTAAGKVYDPAFASFRGHDEFSGADVAAGQSTDGWVIFDVPKASLRGAKVQLQANEFEDLYGYWVL